MLNFIINEKQETVSVCLRFLLTGLPRIHLTPMNQRNPLRPEVLFAVTAFFALPLVAGAVNETSWNGSSGDWSEAGNWSNGLPNNGRNVLISEGEVALNTYSTARLLRVGSAPEKNASLTVEAGGTLQVGSAGVSQLGTGDGADGKIIQNGGNVVIGNSFYIGGFRANGGGRATYTLGDGSLRVYRGDLILAGNTTGSSQARFEQLGGEVESRSVEIGSKRYLGARGAPTNVGEYVIRAGALKINDKLQIGSEDTGGDGEVDATLRIGGAEADVFVRKGIVMFESEKSRPVIVYELAGGKAGTLRVATGGSASISGALKVEFPAGFAVLDAPGLSVLEAGEGSVSGAFSTLPDASLWTLGTKQIPNKRSSVYLSLSEPARRGVVDAARASAAVEFEASASGFVVLEKLKPGSTYSIRVAIHPEEGGGLDTMVAGLVSGGLEAKIAPAGQGIVITGVATAETHYLVWDLPSGKVSAVGL